MSTWKKFLSCGLKLQAIYLSAGTIAGLYTLFWGEGWFTFGCGLVVSSAIAAYIYTEAKNLKKKGEDVREALGLAKGLNNLQSYNYITEQFGDPSFAQRLLTFAEGAGIVGGLVGLAENLNGKFGDSEWNSRYNISRGLVVFQGAVNGLGYVLITFLANRQDELTNESRRTNEESVTRLNNEVARLNEAHVRANNRLMRRNAEDSGSVAELPGIEQMRRTSLTRRAHSR